MKLIATPLLISAVSASDFTFQSQVRGARDKPTVVTEKFHLSTTLVESLTAEDGGACKTIDSDDFKTGSSGFAVWEDMPGGKKQGTVVGAGVPLPKGWEFCEYCLWVVRSSSAYFPGKFYSEQNKEGIDVEIGDNTDVPGLFCTYQDTSSYTINDACSLAEIGWVAPVDGFFTPPSSFFVFDVFGDVELGQVAPIFGYYCPGCALVKPGDKASGPGKFYDCANCPVVDVEVGQRSNATGVFCPSQA